MKKTSGIILFILCVFLLNCEQRKPEFDVANFIEEITEKVILPSITNFRDESARLSDKIKIYVETPTEEHLQQSREQWILTASAYEKAYNFNFGPSKNKFLHQAIYNWPTVSETIEVIINTDTINAASMERLSPQIKSLAAIEYLLFKDSEAALVNEIMLKDESRQIYLLESSLFLKVQGKRLFDIWNEDGQNYSNTFITNEGTGLDDSFNLLFNGLYNAANTAKVTKIGKPAGLEKSPRTSPEKVQAPYSEQSLMLTLQSIETIEEVFFGNEHTNISQYIAAVAKDETTNQRIKTSIKEIKEAIANIPVPLQEAVDLYPKEVKELYSKLNALNIWMGVDCRSLLSVIITSTDNDGD